MELNTEPKQRIYDIFKEFMTGITKLEELGNASCNFLRSFHQGLSFLQRPPVDISSKLLENIVKKNETRRLKSYIDGGCINIHDAAQSTRALHISLSGLSDHLIKANKLLFELKSLTEDASLAIETATKFSAQLDKESGDDELQQVTCNDEEKTTLLFPEAPQVTEYATVIAVVYSMVKQNYAMQEKIVRSLSLKTTSGELETYTLMWSLCPFLQDEVMNKAWKYIY
ncbi:unnamed protein product [Cochlearia groenlandica]